MATGYRTLIKGCLMRDSDNIRFSTVENAILCWLVEKLDAIRNGLVVMRVRGIVGTAWSLGRFEPVRNFVLWILGPTRRYRENKAHEDLAEALKELHGREVVELGRRLRGFFQRCFFSSPSYLNNDKILCSSKWVVLVHFSLPFSEWHHFLEIYRYSYDAQVWFG